MPQPPAAQGQPQPMMYPNAPGQNFGQPPYGQGQWPGQGAQAFNWGPYVPDEGLGQIFFRYDNRLNRKRYIMRSLALFAGLVVLCIVLGVILGLAGVSDSTIGAVGTLFGFACAVPGLMLAIRRLHDLDRPTWWVAGNFVPIVNMALGFYLLLAEGTRGPNQYGPDPLEGKH